MAGEAKRIREKMRATEKTAQITKAMYMVSASKLKRAEKMIENYLFFIAKIEEIVGHLLASDEIMHPLSEERPEGGTCYIIVTSERGLAGPFNNDVYKMLASEYQEGDCVLALGGRGFHHLQQCDYHLFSKEPVMLRDDVLFEDISEALVNVTEGYLSGMFNRVKVIYNHFVNTLVQITTIKQLLPVIFKKPASGEQRPIYDFEGGEESIIDMVIPIYIENIVYGLILDSKASEHASRMNAMSAATDNAEEIIGDLKLMYNRARQSAITAELTDIIGGAAGQTRSLR